MSCFLRWVFERYYVKPQDRCLSTFCDTHAGQKCPQICGIGAGQCSASVYVWAADVCEPGDCTAWCVCNGARNKHLGKISRLILSSDPLDKRTNHTLALPPLRCRQRQAQRGRDLLVAHASGCHIFDHSRCENAYKHLGFESNVGVVCGCVVTCVAVLSMCNVQKPAVFFTNFMVVRFFHQKGAQNRHDFSILGLPSPHCNSQEKPFLCMKMFKRQGNREPKTKRAQSWPATLYNSSQAICKGTEGRVWEELYDHYKEISRADGVKKPNEGQKTKALCKMKAAKGRREDFSDPERKDNILEEIKSDWNCGKSTSKTRLWRWIKR